MRCGAVLPIEAVMQNAERDEGLLSNADVLINATPLGMAGGEDFRRLDFIEYLKPSCTVFDMVYRPDGGDTSLLAASKAAGLTAIGGERLLYHQGLLAFRLWTGIDAGGVMK
jgi:shikimate dehydrogenase